MRRMLFAILLLAVGACGDDDTTTSDAATIDGSTADAAASDAPTSDAATMDATTIDAGSTCSAPATYGAVGAITGTISPTYADPTDNIWFYANLNTDIDEIQLDLYAGYGVFTGDIVPGTYSLVGENDATSCGACIFLIANSGEADEQTFLANGGSLVISSVSPYFAGSLSDIVFTQIDPGTGAPLEDPECASALTSMSFDQGLPGATVDIQVLGITDFHGQLDKNSSTSGGAAELATVFAGERTANPNTLLVSAGDNVGGSPPLSSYFDEEPTIKALKLMGVDVSALGNHEFDRGLTELQSLVDLAAADSGFGFVSSNLSNLSTNLTGVAPYSILDVGRFKVAVIGLTDTDLTQMVPPANIGTLAVTDPAAAIAAARTAAATAGATIFVVAGHLGVTSCTGTPSVCTGQLIDVAAAATGIDLFLGGHTHYGNANTLVGTIPVLQPANKGASYAKVIFSVDVVTGEVVTATPSIVTPDTSTVTPDAAVVAMLAPYRTTLAPIMDAVIGVASATFVRGSNIERQQEVALGDLLCDALISHYSTQLCFTNGGGLRAPLPSSYPPANTSLRRPATGYAAGPPYDLVMGDVYAVLPFGNFAVTRTVNGAQLWDMLENGFSAMPTGGRFPQIGGFHVQVSDSNADPTVYAMTVTSVHLPDGTPILDDTSTNYTIVVNDFINAGGDGYAMLADGTGTTDTVVLPEILADYIEAHTPITPTTDGRIAITYP